MPWKGTRIPSHETPIATTCDPAVGHFHDSAENAIRCLARGDAADVDCGMARSSVGLRYTNAIRNRSAVCWSLCP